MNGEKTEFDDLISALRTGDVFGENMDKFRRNRFVVHHRSIIGEPLKG